MKGYSFLNTTVVVNGVPLIHWSEGDDVIQFKRRSNQVEDVVGADGKMMVSISGDKSGEITFKLHQTSPSNKYLMNLCNAQGAGSASFVPCSILFQDTNRQDRGSGTVGYIQKPADLTRGMKGNATEWTIIVERLDILLGDPSFSGFPTALAENL